MKDTTIQLYLAVVAVIIILPLFFLTTNYAHHRFGEWGNYTQCGNCGYTEMRDRAFYQRMCPKCNAHIYSEPGYKDWQGRGRYDFWGRFHKASEEAE